MENHRTGRHIHILVALVCRDIKWHYASTACFVRMSRCFTWNGMQTLLSMVSSLSQQWEENRPWPYAISIKSIIAAWWLRQTHCDDLCLCLSVILLSYSVSFKSAHHQPRSMENQQSSMTKDWRNNLDARFSSCLIEQTLLSRHIFIQLRWDLSYSVKIWGHGGFKGRGETSGYYFHVQLKVHFIYRKKKNDAFFCVVKPYKPTTSLH